VLNHIAVRPFPEQPAGKDPPPLVVALRPHVELNKGAGFLPLFPGRGGFAGAQPDNRIAHAQRLARLHLQVTGKAVALVEKTDDRDAIGHRRRPGDIAHRREGLRIRSLLHRIGGIGPGQLIRAVSASLRRERKQEDRQRAPHHDASGVHAS